MARVTGLALVFLLLLLTLGQVTFGQTEESVKIINALKAGGSPKIDGILDEDCWQSSEKSGGFVHWWNL